MRKVAKKSKPKIEETLEKVAEVITEIVVEEIEHSIKPFDLAELPEINEEKHNTFLRLAKPRTQKVVHSLKILGNCANKGSYDYTHLEIVKMFDYIQKALDETRDKFQRKIAEQKKVFNF